VAPLDAGVVELETAREDVEEAGALDEVTEGGPVFEVELEDWSVEQEVTVFVFVLVTAVVPPTVFIVVTVVPGAYAV
jgi:hypothetical protein